MTLRCAVVAARFSAALGLELASLAACQRKAPGPTECVAFARAVVFAASGTQIPLVAGKEAIDALTVRCLTTPFSRSLLRCVEQGNAARHCFAKHGVPLQNAPAPEEVPFFNPEF